MKASLPHALLRAQYLNLADRHIRQHTWYQVNDSAFQTAWKLFCRSTQEVYDTLAELSQQIEQHEPTSVLARLKADTAKAADTLASVSEHRPSQNVATAAVSALLSLMTAHPQKNLRA